MRPYFVDTDNAFNRQSRRSGSRRGTINEVTLLPRVPQLASKLSVSRLQSRESAREHENYSTIPRSDPNPSSRSNIFKGASPTSGDAPSVSPPPFDTPPFPRPRARGLDKTKRKKKKKKERRTSARRFRRRPLDEHDDRQMAFAVTLARGVQDRASAWTTRRAQKRAARGSVLTGEPGLFRAARTYGR